MAASESDFLNPIIKRVSPPTSEIGIPTAIIILRTVSLISWNSRDMQVPHKLNRK